MATQQNFEGLSPPCLFLPNLVSAELGLRGGHSAQITGTCVLAWQGGHFSLPPPSSFLLALREGASQSRLLLLFSFLD